MVVVGAGIVGCAIAWELARRGASVTVLDGRDVGRGATQASAGVLAPFLELQRGTALRSLGARSLAMFGEFIAGVVAESGMPVQYGRTGTLEVATSASDLERLRSLASDHRADGIACELVDEGGIREVEPHLGNEIAGGLLVRPHGFVAASELTAALGRAATLRGAVISAAQTVRRISSDGRHVLLETPQATMSAGGVVLAAGCWSGQLEVAGAERLPVRPVRGQLLYLGWSGTPLRHVLWSTRCYLVPWADGTVLVGATVEEAGFDERATAAGARDLLEAACSLTPMAAQAAFQGVRVGLRPATPDDVPIIGASAAVPRLVYATGHYRNGVLLAPLTAALVADLVLESRVDPALETMSPARFGRT